MGTRRWWADGEVQAAHVKQNSRDLGTRAGIKVPGCAVLGWGGQRQGVGREVLPRSWDTVFGKEGCALKMGSKKLPREGLGGPCVRTDWGGFATRGEGRESSTAPDHRGVGPVPRTCAEALFSVQF